MDKWKSVLLIVVALVATVGACAAAVIPEPPFKVKSRAAVLVNAVSGQIICAKNPDEQIPPASLTKLMTLLVALDAVDNGYVTLADEVKISKKAWRTGGSKMFLEVDTSVPLQLLLQGIAVVSANDACVAVAEYIAGVEDVFVEKMNRKAAEIGMDNTVFKNSHGLPVDGQLTTARDMATLAQYYIRKHPEIVRMHSIKEMTYNKITQRNRNGLLWLDNGVDGLKTGWFTKAGYHMVATAYQSQDRYIAVVMGAKNESQRENIAMQLMNYGFRNFSTTEVLAPDKELAAAAVWKGVRGRVTLGAPGAVSVTVPRDAPGEIVIEKDFTDMLYAPVLKGQELGRLRILMQDKVIESLPLVALEDVARAGALKVAMHGAALFFIQPPYWGGLLLALLFVVVVMAEIASLRKKKKKKSGIGGIDNLIG